MKKFGLIGHPIEHSMSPRLFSAAYGGRYQYDLILGADFEKSWQRFLDEYDGINVTAPFKDLAYAKADILSPEVEATMASNLLVKTSLGIEAHNSDFLGVAKMIRELSDGLRSKGGRPLRSVLVVGCGGAAKAAAAAAYMQEMEVTVANRSVEKAQAFVDHLSMFGLLRPCSAGGSINACGLDRMPSADLVIYCLPVQIPQMDDLSMRFFIEANYRDPAYSQKYLDESARNSGNSVYIDGSRWLVAQAVTGYALFTGEEPDADAVCNAI